MTRTSRRAIVLLLLAGAAGAQPLPRRATNISALITYPGFYHQRPITVAGTLVREEDGQLQLSDDVGSMMVVYEGSVTDGLHEVRGDFWDLGRMNADDPRLARFDASAVFDIAPDAPWPSPGQVTAIIAGDVQPVLPPVTPSIRATVLHPARFLDERVTITGQFAGRNLLGDLPDAPANSRWDFVLRSGDGAIWVSHVRPRGRDFELALDQRVDTGRWLEVTGVLRQRRGLQWLDATETTVALAKPPEEDPEPSQAAVRVPAGPPPEAIFSAPTEGEIAVNPSTTVRIQFSRNLDAATVNGNIRARYAGGVPAPDATAEIALTADYRPGSRMIEISFKEPLERFRTVEVELLDGILGTDQQPLVPWTLTFETGG